MIFTKISAAGGIALMAIIAAPVAQAATFDNCNGFEFSEVADIPGDGDGSVLVTNTGKGCAFRLKGSDSQSEEGGQVVTSFGAVADQNLQVTGTFDYSSKDEDAGFDFFGFFVGDEFTILAGLDELAATGTFSFGVNIGESFGFFVESVDDTLGRAKALVNASFTPVPLPAGLPLLGGGLVLMAGFGRRRSCRGA